MNEDAVYKALADSTRRLILQELADHTNQTLFELCGRLTMNHHVNKYVTPKHKPHANKT